MTDKNALIISPLVCERIDEVRDRLTENGIEFDVLETEHYLRETELIDVLGGYDGVIAEDDQFTERVFENAGQLSAISQCGVGTDNVDHEAAERFGVRTMNTPGVYSDEVADVVVGYTVMLARKLHEIDSAVRAGEWPDARGTTLAGKTFGIVGVGDIGSCVARRVSAFGMDVVGYDVVQISGSLRTEIDIEPVGLHELFERSRIVSLHCPLTPDTETLVGEPELSALGEDGYLINTARGELVDESALVAALEADRLGGAALDVFETEPLPEDHPFVESGSVVLGSHNAYNTEEAVTRVTNRAVDNLVDALS